MQALVNFLLNHRILLAALTLLFGGLVATGIMKTQINSNYDTILSEDDPYRKQVQQVQEDFPPSTTVLFTFMSKEGDVFDMASLQAMQELTDRYTEVESAIAVGSLLNRRLNAVDADKYDRDYLIPDLRELEEADLAAIRRI
ncbi:MAG: hypothetical protein V7709_18205, partial [Halioglobus sp.]